jgi:hypothetical protein
MAFAISFSEWIDNTRLGKTIPNLIGGDRSSISKIVMIDKMTWSWKRAKFGVALGLIFGLVLAFVALIANSFFHLYHIDSISGQIPLGLEIILIAVIYSGMFVGLSVEQIEEVAYPGQRLKRTLINAFLPSELAILMLLAILLFSLVWNSSYSFSALPLKFLIYFILSIIAAGIYFFILRGDGFIQHYALRLVMTKFNLLPWRLIPFLEYSVNLIFLRRVGGSYIFVHRLLMEHFAEMDLTPRPDRAGK